MTNKDFNKLEIKVSHYSHDCYKVILLDGEESLAEMLYDIIAADLEENPLDLDERQVDKIHEAVWEYHNDISVDEIDVSDEFADLF